MITPTLPDTTPPGASDEDRAAVRAQLAANIDNACASIYNRICRFAMEYELREAQAKTYAAAGYNGTVPRQVDAFATRAGIAARQATDIILEQATGYRAALDNIGDLRMRKFSLKGMTDAAAHVEFSIIMAAINTVDRALT